MVVRILFLMVIAAWPSAAFGESMDEPESCCRSSLIRKVESMFGLPSLDTLALHGTEVRRSAIIGGYSGPQYALSFVRPKVGGPYLEVSGLWGPRLSVLPYRPRTRVMISEDVWQKVAALEFPLTAVKDSAIGGPETSEPEDVVGEIIVCTDGYSMMNESLSRLPQKAKMVRRRSIDHTCGAPYLEELAEFLYGTIPGCRDLMRDPAYPDFIRDPRKCALLQDYGSEAATLVNAFEAKGKSEFLPSLFATDIAILVQGQQPVSGKSAQSFWKSRASYSSLWDLRRIEPGRYEASIYVSLPPEEGKAKWGYSLATGIIRVAGEKIVIDRLELGRARRR
jgi:hypothetical protein